MRCDEIKFGTGDCAYNIMLPYLCKDTWEDDEHKRPKYISIDKCLLPEIMHLWELGIKTTGCCCGHGTAEPFIGVKFEYIGKMKELGYVVRFNSCRPNDEDSFVPKTQFQYGEIKKGFNWWD